MPQIPVVRTRLSSPFFQIYTIHRSPTLLNNPLTHLNFNTAILKFRNVGNGRWFETLTLRLN